MKTILKVILRALLLLVAIFVIFLVWATITDYKPDSITSIDMNISIEPGVLSDSAELSVMIWNIGYCGLDKSMDFFYDGGEQVRPPKENVEANILAARKFLSMNVDNFDFILLQEVDKNSKRSWNFPIYDNICSDLAGFYPAFAANYKVGFVPVPPTNPMGKVHSGLASFTKPEPVQQDRYDFPGSYSWPTSLFMLDRCFLVQRFKVDNGKEFILVNTHNSAYDDGSLKAAEMGLLHGFVSEEYAKGNYILVGGDWNQCAPDFVPMYTSQPFDTIDLKYIPNDFLPTNWTYAYDAGTPTNRRVATVFEEGKTITTVIDYFLASPNIEVLDVEGVNLNFENSDHNPVRATFKLIK